MPRKWILGLSFVLSLVVFLTLLMPAAVVLERMPALRIGGAPLALSAPRGPWWQGQCQWRWQQLQGDLQWDLDWHGLVPGLQLSLQSRPGLHGDAKLSGWLGADWGDWHLEQARFSIPVALVAEHVPQGQADGRVDGTILSLKIAEQAILDAQGTAQYSGGLVTWGRNGSAKVPALDGRLSMESGVPTLQVVDPQGTELVVARIADERFQLQVLRAWPMLLGVSEGGEADDVVFQMSQPFKLGQG